MARESECVASEDGRAVRVSLLREGMNDSWRMCRGGVKMCSVRQRLCARGGE